MATFGLTALNFFAETLLVEFVFPKVLFGVVSSFSAALSVSSGFIE